MTTSNPPSKAPGKTLSDAASAPTAPTAPTVPAAPAKDVSAKDALSDLPPMPKTKPAKSAPATRATRATQPAQAAPGSKVPAKPDATPLPDAMPLMVTKKELFTRVKARTGKIKGHDVRAVMDVLLDEVGAALVNGETLKLPSLGTMKVQRHKPQAKADVVVCKLNRKKPAAKVKDPLAKPPKGS